MSGGSKKDMFLLNINSKKIHLAASTDKRCKIHSMREEYKVYFPTLDEALCYPTKEKPLAKKCSFCLADR